MSARAKKRVNNTVHVKSTYGSTAVSVDVGDMPLNITSAVKTLLRQGKTNFSYLALNGLDLGGEQLKGCCFHHCQLQQANFVDANLAAASFSSADLTGAKFRCADIRAVNMRYATLSRADFTDACVDGVTWSAHEFGSPFTWIKGSQVKGPPIKEITRSDGYTFRLLEDDEGLFRVSAGCRWFTIDEAWNHWSCPRHWTANSSIDQGIVKAFGSIQEETQDILFLFDQSIERIKAARAADATPQPVEPKRKRA